MGVKIIEYFKEFNGVVIEIFEESEYNFQIYCKNVKIHDIDIKLYPNQHFWISWDDIWEDKMIYVYSNGLKIMADKIFGVRTIQKKILDSYDINFLEFL